MSAKRTRKLFPLPMLAVVSWEGVLVGVYGSSGEASMSAWLKSGRIVPVLVSEIPKPSQRKKVKRGK